MFDSLFSKGGLSLAGLRCLLEVHEAGSIAKAAPGDSNRQTQYSKQLRKLSEFFGCELTERRGKVLRLTDEGEELVRLVRSHFSDLEDFRATCHEEKATYVLASGDSVIHWLVLPRLKPISDRFPRIRFSTSNLRTDDIVRQIDDGRAHFGILREDAVPSQLASVSLGVLAYAVVIPRILLVKRKRVPDLQQIFNDLPLVGLSSRGKYVQELRSAFAAAGCIYSPTLTCESFPQMLQAVVSGSCYGVLPKIAARALSESDFEVIESAAIQSLSRPISLSWAKRTEEIRLGFSALRDALANAFKL